MSNETRHTPRSWVLTMGEHDAVISAGVTIAEVPDHAFAWRENALLISAAPELLGALEACERVLESEYAYQRHAAAKIARATIAKAKGV